MAVLRTRISLTVDDSHSEPFGPSALLPATNNGSSLFGAGQAGQALFCSG
jgi:hypothetical protein